jgi:hypothetical protein
MVNKGTDHDKYKLTSAGTGTGGVLDCLVEVTRRSGRLPVPEVILIGDRRSFAASAVLVVANTGACG